MKQSATDKNFGTTDTISRQAAIDAECEVCQIAPKKERGHNCTYYVHGCKEIECLRALPSAQQWIPVTERLPEVGREVLTYTGLVGLIEIQSIEKHIGNVHWENQHGDWQDLNTVTAWMPLPKPYEGSETE